MVSYANNIILWSQKNMISMTNTKNMLGDLIHKIIVLRFEVLMFRNLGLAFVEARIEQKSRQKEFQQGSMNLKLSIERNKQLFYTMYSKDTIICIVKKDHLISTLEHLASTSKARQKFGSMKTMV